MRPMKKNLYGKQQKILSLTWILPVLLLFIMCATTDEVLETPGIAETQRIPGIPNIDIRGETPITLFEAGVETTEARIVGTNASVRQPVRAAASPVRQPEPVFLEQITITGIYDTLPRLVFIAIIAGAFLIFASFILMPIVVTKSPL